MMWLPDGEKISQISLFVLAQLTNVTDGRTDTACRHTLDENTYRAYAYASRGKNHVHRAYTLRNNGNNLLAKKIRNS